MRRFTLNSRLLSLILYGYYKNISIIEAAVKKENRLDMIMELYNTSTPNLIYIDIINIIFNSFIK